MQLLRKILGQWKHEVIVSCVAIGDAKSSWLVKMTL